jgi:hypothetical protein
VRLAALLPLCLRVACSQVLFPFPGPGPPVTASGPPTTFVQSAKVVDGTNGQLACVGTCSFTVSTPVAGHLVLVSETVNCSTGGTNISVAAPTDNQTGNTYTKLAASDGQPYEATSLWGSVISGTGSPFTVTGNFTGGAGTCSVQLTLSEFANCTLTVDQSAAGSVPDSVPPQVVSITTLNAADLVVSVIGNAASGNMFWSPVSGFTQIWPGTSPFGGWLTGTWYQITTTTGTFTSPSLTLGNQCSGSGCTGPGPSGGSVIVALKQ